MMLFTHTQAVILPFIPMKRPSVLITCMIKILLCLSTSAFLSASSMHTQSVPKKSHHSKPSKLTQAAFLPCTCKPLEIILQNTWLQNQSTFTLVLITNTVVTWNILLTLSSQHFLSHPPLAISVKLFPMSSAYRKLLTESGKVFDFYGKFLSVAFLSLSAL